MESYRFSNYLPEIFNAVSVRNCLCLQQKFREGKVSADIFLVVLPEERLETPPLIGLGSWDPLQERLLKIRKDRTERTPQERGGTDQRRPRHQRSEVQSF